MNCVKNDDGIKLNATIWAGEIFNDDIQTESMLEIQKRNFFSQQIEVIITHSYYIRKTHIHDIGRLRMNPTLPFDCANIFPILQPEINSKHPDGYAGQDFGKITK